MMSKRSISLVLSLWVIIGSNPAWSQVVDQNQCLLKIYAFWSFLSCCEPCVEGMQLSVVSHFFYPPWKANEAERLYNECLLLNLGHVNNDNAALLISQVCYDQYRSRFHFR